MPKQLHRHGVVTNHGPRSARFRREMSRIAASVRKVLWRKPGTMLLWVERDRLQAKANGSGFFDYKKLTEPYRGWVLGIGTRALLCLRGAAPDDANADRGEQGSHSDADGRGTRGLDSLPQAPDVRRED